MKSRRPPGKGNRHAIQLNQARAPGKSNTAAKRYGHLASSQQAEPVPWHTLEAYSQGDSAIAQDAPPSNKRETQQAVPGAVPAKGFENLTETGNIDETNAIQMRNESTLQPALNNLNQVAQTGLVGPSSKLPHRETIQAAFGHHDLTSVQAHIGGAASNATKAMGAEAYATGNQVAFNQPPDLHTAAHEAAHVVQQRQGVQLKGGVGQAGDAYEKQADLAADAVVAGKSAERILGPSHSSSSPAIGVQKREAAAIQKPASSTATDAEQSIRAQEDAGTRIPAGVTISFSGAGAVLGIGPLLPDKLPDLQWLRQKLVTIRRLERPLVGPALRSVQNRPEMAMRIQNCTKQGMRIELPASYPTNPPTPAMKRLVAVNRATLILEHMIEAKQKEMSRLTIRQDEVGGRPIEGTLEDIEGYRRSLVVRKILGSLTGSIGGSFGFLVGGLLTDNPEKIAAASAMGNTIVGTFSSARALNPGTSTRGLPKAKHSYSLRSIRKTRQTPAKNKTREADAKRTIVVCPL